MNTPDVLRPISSELAHVLSRHYPADHVEALTQDWRFASLPHHPGERMPYVRIGQQDAKRHPR